jgi:hypothetical protein
LTELISIDGYEANREALHAVQHTLPKPTQATKQFAPRKHYYNVKPLLFGQTLRCISSGIHCSYRARVPASLRWARETLPEPRRWVRAETSTQQGFIPPASAQQQGAPAP